jgi:putative chitinase
MKIKGDINMFYNRKAFFDKVRVSLPEDGKLSQEQVEGLELLLVEGERRNFNTEWIAYILATIWHETGFTMQPVRETFAKTDADAIARLDRAFNSGKLKSVSKPYWREGYFGRGYIQLTHDYNYKKMGEWLKLDLLKNPSLALDPKISAQIAYEGMLQGMFTAKKLGDYLDGKDGYDAEDEKQFTEARRIINGKDKAKNIAKYALKFESALRGSEGVAPVIENTKPNAKEPDPIVMPKVPEVKQNPMKNTTIWSSIAALLTSVFAILANLNPIIQGLLIIIIAVFVGFIIYRASKSGNGIEGLF